MLLERGYMQIDFPWCAKYISGISHIIPQGTWTIPWVGTTMQKELTKIYLNSDKPNTY
jgi:hypothetical protein